MRKGTLTIGGFLAALAAFPVLSACAPEPEPKQQVFYEAPVLTAAEMPLPSPGIATEATRTTNAAVAARLDLADPADAEKAARGFLAAIEETAITAPDGRTVWQVPQFDFLSADAPETVNPSLWRQSRLAARHGLFEVVPGIYQVRGYDLAVMTVIEGESGWIIVDPLTTIETAAAALRLVNETLGARQVTGVIYTHSHVDHFGGARGVISEEEIAARNVPVLAPAGFVSHAVAENLLAGNQMSRRAALMFGSTLPRSATGHIGSGLGPGLPDGTISLVLPTEEIAGRATRRTIDGVVFEFIDAAGTEAPAEFMFYLPELRALCTAEVATATLHNILTPRGAKVRDALAWSRAIDGVLQDYGGRSDVVFASHHWPTWGQAEVSAFLAGQRDIYRYIHDQTLRHANAGATQGEAAEAISEPPFQAEQFSTRGYYGTLNHNSKAVYQHYFGWWSGVPANYHALPHEQSASRYVAALGGAAAVLERGQAAFAAGDYRWAAELLNHLVFADAANKEARDWLAAAYEQLGFQAESGAWRSYYLTAAAELRRGLPEVEGASPASLEFLRAVPSLDLFDALAARFNPEKLQRPSYALEFRFSDTGETISVLVTPSVLVPRAGPAEAPVATVRLTRSDFDRLLLRDVGAARLLLTRRMQIDGERAALSAMFDSLDQPQFWFNIVEP